MTKRVLTATLLVLAATAVGVTGGAIVAGRIHIVVDRQTSAQSKQNPEYREVVVPGDDSSKSSLLQKRIHRLEVKAAERERRWRRYEDAVGRCEQDPPGSGLHRLSESCQQSMARIYRP